MILNGKNAWLKIFKDLKEKGKVCSPRGEKILEIEDYHIDFHPINDRFCSFKERNLDLAYLAGEFAWYVSGDRNDLRIIEYSKFWNKVKNPIPPYFNSNYGYYIFIEGQLNYVADTLIKDKDSRQACIMINREQVMTRETTDKLCTNSIMFRIRDNKLNMTVQMRSNDAIFGLGIDACMFSFIYETLYVKLKKEYPDLEIGNYHHTASSFHIYERHWDMMDKILESNGENYIEIDCPEMVEEEVNYILGYLPKIEESIRCGKEKVGVSYKFTNFLIEKLTDKWNKV